MSLRLTAAMLTGRDHRHIGVSAGSSLAATPATLDAFARLRRAAARDGVNIRGISGYRDIRRQVRIWNRKHRLQSPLLDREGRVLDGRALSRELKVFSILRWSALPGASRHHWGTDIDVVDGAAVDRGAPIKLTPQETAPGGVFREVYEWLTENMHYYGFYRPYSDWRGGIYPEPWHISFIDGAEEARRRYSYGALRDAVTSIDLDGVDVVMEWLPHIYETFVINVAEPPTPQAWRRF